MLAGVFMSWFWDTSIAAEGARGGTRRSNAGDECAGAEGELAGAPVTGAGLGHVPALLPFCSQCLDTLAHPGLDDAASRTPSTGRERFQGRAKTKLGAICATERSVAGLRPGWPGSGAARCERPSNPWTSPLPLPPRAAGALDGGQAVSLQQHGSRPGEGSPRLHSRHVLDEPAHFVLER